MVPSVLGTISPFLLLLEHQWDSTFPTLPLSPDWSSVLSTLGKLCVPCYDIKDMKLTTSINTMIGSSCMYIMLKSVWPSLDRLPNRIPAHIGITSAQMIAFFVFWLSKLSLPFR
jgi:hypothetical protein